MPVGALAGLLKNPMMLILLIVIIGLILTPIGLLFLGITILSGAIVAVLIGLFIPAILVLVGFLVLFCVVPGIKPPWNLLGSLCFVSAYVMWSGVLGQMALAQLGFGMWPWEWPGDIASVLNDAIGLIGAVIIALFIFIFGLGVILGKIPVPGGNIGKWIIFLIAFGIAAGVMYYIVILGG